MSKISDFFVDAKQYKYKTWKKYLAVNKKISFKKLITNTDWHKFIDAEYSIKDDDNKNYLKELENILTKMIEDGKDIYPYPELLFYALNILSPEDIKAICIGQDPYHNHSIHDDIIIPNSMGMSFSAPYNTPPPDSLSNIYKNLVKYKHISENHHKTSNLISWLVQGCFFINNTWTVFPHSANSHKHLWNTFTEHLLEYINKNYNNIVYLFWGAFAHNKSAYINKTNNLFIVSSHPSPYSFSSQYRQYPAFIDCDHFGLTNEYLKSVNRTPIIW